jgi:small subunit ribosomal protein S6
MADSKQHLYEGMYIVSALLNDDARNKTFEKIKDGITRRGGKILKEHDQGKRRLAYPIRSEKEGHYFLIYFDAPASSIKDMWQELRLNENLIRYCTQRAARVMDELKFKQLPEQ